MTSAPPFAHVAACIDDSPAAEVVLAEAARLAGLGCRVTVVHVIEPPNFMGALVSGVAAAFGGGGGVDDHVGHREVAEAFLESSADTVPGAGQVLLDPAEHDSVPDAVCDWLAESDADLVLAATHKGALERARRALGSFSAHLAYHSPSPVMLIPPAAPKE